MDDVSARVVNDAELEEEPSCPDTISTHDIGQGQPQWHEHHPRVEVHSAKISTSDKDDGDSGENELEVHHRRLWKSLSEVGRGECALLELVVDAENGARHSHERQHVFSKAGLVTPYTPAQQNHTEGVEHHKS